MHSNMRRGASSLRAFAGLVEASRWGELCGYFADIICFGGDVGMQVKLIAVNTNART